jgi:transmembrane sensor
LLKDKYVQAHLFKALLRKYRAGKASSEEIKLVEDWYASFGETFPQKDLKTKTALGNELHTRLQRELFPNQSPRLNKQIRYLLQKAAVAAMIFVVIGIGIWSFIYYNGTRGMAEKRRWVELSVGHGRLKKVQLPDSTFAWLNAGTKIGFSLPFGNMAKREVTLLEGEVFFDVRPNPAKPFIVHANGLDTRVLGTSFSVRSYKDLNELRISVATGMVQITDNQKQLLGVLHPGEEVVYNKETLMSAIRQVDVETRKAWISGVTYLSEVPFAELSMVFRNVYGTPLKAGKKAIALQRYSIQLDRNTREEDLIHAICAIHNNRYRKEGDAIIIY